ncbi:AI-2E family transporter [Ruminococcus sp. OA3]|uniref:AI-2E family transporter n=1 Tax=Ruminococcus sp. OA3 TaxID=2914164 RepID=UPI001F066CBE|nr:AI-2E family transporter [Ruminococcus sp. OA3]MCH1983301.1 AI-2E family transporter [Ruminococcus sp. OA3]
MKFRWDKKYLYWGATAFVVLAAAMLFYFGIFHVDSLKSLFNKVYSILQPLIYGAAIAYILNPLVRFLEEQVFFRLIEKTGRKLTERLKKVVRMICVIFVILLLFLVIYGLIAMMVPELIKSITNIVENFPRYIRTAETWVTDLLKDNPDLEAYSLSLFTTISDKAETWLNQDLLPQVNEIVRNFSTGVYDVLIFLKNFLIGAMISIYMLYGKETFIARGKQFLYALRSTPENANRTIRDLQFVDRTFGGFVVGKIVDSIIIGLLCYIGMSVLKLPYTMLISVIIGITNVIPFFGPYIGAVPSAFLILLINPLQCLYFIIFILVLQQFDGNFLGPKILGDTTGLSSFMVIVAILVGGGLFGVFGMFVGVPVCAVICTIIGDRIQERLKKKKLPEDVTSYRNIDHLDQETHEPVFQNTMGTDDSKPFSKARRKDTDVPENEQKKKETDQEDEDS